MPAPSSSQIARWAIGPNRCWPKLLFARFPNGWWCNMATRIALPLVTLGSSLPTWRVWKERANSGKRPDLLLFPAKAGVARDLSAQSHAETESLVKQATAAIEVRSSKFEALTYMRVRQQQRAAGKTTAGETPSFTVKVEDLLIVYRWLERHGVPELLSGIFRFGVRD